MPTWNILRCRRGTAMVLLAPVALCANLSAGAADMADPADYVGRSRVLLVFAPARDDARLIEQERAIEADKAGAAERDLVLLTVVGTSPADAENDRLRRRYRVAPDQFAALLIGKDGGSKMRSPDAIRASVLFATIDAMPMRRAEMRR